MLCMFVCSFVCLFVRWLVRSFDRSFVGSLVRWLVGWFVRSFVRLLNMYVRQRAPAIIYDDHCRPALVPKHLTYSADLARPHRGLQERDTWEHMNSPQCLEFEAWDREHGTALRTGCIGGAM